MDKIKFATLYAEDSVMRLMFGLESNDILVLFVDENKPKRQDESYNMIIDICKKKKIKFEEVILPLYDMVEIANILNKQITKYKDKELYFDISRSKRSQGFAIITSLSVLKPENLKDVTYFSRDDNLDINVPIPRAEDLSESEIKALEYVSNNKKFFQKELADNIGLSAMQGGRIIEGLIKNKLVKKEDSNYELTDLGKIYLLK